MKNKKMLEIQKCCICGEIFLGCGHNPWPITNEGRCCDKCNLLTIQRRIQLYNQQRSKS